MLRAELFGTLVVLLASSTSTGARAESAETPPRSAHHDAALDVGSGVFLDGHGFGAAARGTALYRRGLLVVGGLGEMGQSFFGRYGYAGGAATAGISAPSPRWIRLDLLGALGVHSYWNVGSQEFPMYGVLLDEGSSALLPYAGLRLRSSVAFGTSKRFTIGLEASAETDVTRVTRTTEVTAFGIGHRETSNHTRTVGTERLAGALTFGGAFDL